MIFTPFTGKDNYGRCVTFGAGLISNEDVEAYSWILEKFILCMGKHPNVIITDQDPALKIAVEKVLPGNNFYLFLYIFSGMSIIFFTAYIYNTFLLYFIFLFFSFCNMS